MNCAASSTLNLIWEVYGFLDRYMIIPIHSSSPSSDGVRIQSQVQGSIIKKADAFYWWTILLSTISQTEEENNVEKLALCLKMRTRNSHSWFTYIFKTLYKIKRENLKYLCSDSVQITNSRTSEQAIPLGCV